MLKALLHFAAIVATFLLLTRYVPGFYLRDWGSAALAALIFGFVNATLGFVLKLLTFPLVLVTFGLFSLVVNAVMLIVVAFIVPGFSINGFWPALIAALALGGVNLLWKAATGREDEDRARD
jgi:putative membrane protein